MAKKKKAVNVEEKRRFVAGIDLAGHADHYVCGPRNDDGTHDVEHFGTTTPELQRMVLWLQERKVVSVAMESTGVYWIPVYDIIEAAGIEACLVDTRTLKMCPGHKSDVKDCQWIQKFHSCNILNNAFRPPECFNAIRSVFREQENVLQMRVQAIQSIQKAMDQMNIRLHHAVSDITNLTGMKILEAIVNGERNPHELAKLRDRRCKKNEAQIAEELTGNWREEHLFTLTQSYELLRFIDGRIERYDEKIRALYAELAKQFPVIELPLDKNSNKKKKAKDKIDVEAKADLTRICRGFDITRIDGIGYDTAAMLLSELGPNLSAFPTEKQLVSYAGLAPPLGKSAGKNVSTRRKFKNTSRIGLVLRQAAASLGKSDSFLGAYFRSVRSRTCTKTAIKATARMMLKLIYRGLKYGQEYVDKGAENHDEQNRDRSVAKARRIVKKYNMTLEELGFEQKVS